MKKNILIKSILIVLVIFSVVFIYKYNKKDNVINTYDNNNIVEKKQFAMYIQNQAKTGYDKYTGNSTSFPEGYEVNTTNSVCTDLNGNVVENVYTFNNGKISLTSNKTVFCTFYFDKIRGYGTILEGSPYLSTEKLGDLLGDNSLYRYQGTYEEVTNNYICFNTDSKSTCLSDTERYMYRILGITQDNRMKLIKNEAITQGGDNNTGTHGWHNKSAEEDCTGTNCDWAHSTLYNDLNSSYYLTNSYYIDSTNNWDDKILSVNWKYGDVASSVRYTYSYNNAFAAENAFGNQVNAKIGLMYMYDYFYANNWDGTQNYGTNESPVRYGTNGWIHRSHTDNNVPNNWEWMITRYGLDSGGHYSAWRVRPDGSVGNYWLDDTRSVRPVFYLTNEITLTGTGTITDPYIIGSPAVS